MKNSYRYFTLFLLLCVVIVACTDQTVTVPNNPQPTLTLPNNLSPTEVLISYDPNILAIIARTASTNLPGIILTINKDRSGSLVFQNRRYYQFPDSLTPVPYNLDSNFPFYQGDKDAIKKNMDYPKGTFNTTNLEIILGKIDDVETIPPIMPCGKSVSFSSYEYIIYKGKVSPDLDCVVPFNETDSLYKGLKTAISNLQTTAGLSVNY